MTATQSITKDSLKTEEVQAQNVRQTPVERIFEKLTYLDLPCREHFQQYMLHKRRINHKPRTIRSCFTAIVLFLSFCKKLGRTCIEEIERSDIEAFIEHEQDRGMAIISVRVRIASVIAFLHFLMEQDVIPGTILKKRIKLKLPEALPRAINPVDVRRFLTVVDNIRDRALILLLLRTGMRIGEALGLTLNDLDLRERKVHLFVGEKNSMGRVVYLSDDCLFALKRWLTQRRTTTDFLFPGLGSTPICYSTARYRILEYFKKAGISHKGYTVHCLRHTFASELLNAGMRLECLQQLMGHQDIEVTRRYARLTDRTREEEYFRAMAAIEKGGIDGDY